MSDGPRLLSIGDVAQRTGVSAGTLRAWERRYGFPEPERLPGGHRRYREAEIRRILAVAEGRSSGLSVGAAIDLAVRVTAESPSLFAEVRRARPGLRPQRLEKRVLTALSHAVEDECMTWAGSPVLFAAFQRERFFRESEARWRDLSARADQAIVVAEFAEPDRAGTPVKLGIEADGPMSREWALVCHDAHHSAFLVGIELPGQGLMADPHRDFDVIWSVEPDAVLAAARAAAALVRGMDDELGRELEESIAARPGPSADAQVALGAAITARLLARL